MAKAVKHEYSANMRRAMYDSLLQAAKNKNMTLTQYCTQWWEEDWRAALRAFAMFLPRESKIEGEITHRSLVDVLASIEKSAAEDFEVESGPSTVRH